MENPKFEGKINLRELVSVVREQLEELDRERTSAHKPALFHLKSMELDIHFAVEEADSTKGGLDLKIVSIGGKNELRTEQVQRISLRFEVPTGTAVEGSRAHSSGQSKGQREVVPLK